MATRKKTAKLTNDTPRRQCGTMSAHNRLLEESPAYRRSLVELETMTTHLRARPEEAVQKVITIPVVVHIVYKRSAENISVAQVKSQITVLNKDFRAKNSDRSKVPTVWKGLVTDSLIQFKLATKDPKGKTTTGITRTLTNRDSFGTGDTVKSAATGGADAWPTNKYLNIWVCTLAGGLLGYAQFPGGPKATDGVVIRNGAFGTSGTAASPFNLGRTAVHEVGHWLNLRHIWGDTEDCSGSDLVADTPNAATPNFDKPTFPHISCSNGPNGDMFMNYMDYVDDAAMFMFTAQQVARMHAALKGPRKSFLT